MIREVCLEELGECASLIRKSFLTVANKFGFTEQNAPRFTAFSVTEDRLKDQWQGEHRPMYVYCKEDKIVGYYSLAWQDNDECELNNLCVLPDERNSGIGMALVKHAFDTAKVNGKTIVNIGIVEENVPLRKWYEKLGFVHTGTKKFDFFPFTCGYMKKQL